MIDPFHPADRHAPHAVASGMFDAEAT